MHPKRTFLRLSACAIVAIRLLLLFPGSASSQDESEPPRTAVVGVMVAPPLFIKTADNRWEGFSVELWKAVAERIDIPYEFREFSSLESIIDALASGQIDVIPSMAVRERLVSRMDFGQSFLKSGLAIAVPAEGVELRWLRVVESLFSRHILSAIGLLLLMSLVAGVAVWLFERRGNSEMFGHGIGEGIGHGIWWAMVTMTTVGYGDKAPRSMGGRITAMAWMVFSIVFIASFTANITASLTISELKGKVRGFQDLYSSRVGALSRSEGFDYLIRQGISPIPLQQFQEGLRAVADRKIDAFVQDETILRHLAKTEFPGRVQVLPENFDEYFVSMALKEKSPLRKPVNKALLKFMKTEKWTELQNRYLK
jgi:ABC-type amino acid transport substrate-binding protein